MEYEECAVNARPAPTPRHGRLDRHDMGTVGRVRVSHMVEHPGCPNGCRKAWRVFLHHPQQDPASPEWKPITGVWTVECKECGYNA